MDRKSNHKVWLAIWVVLLAVGQTTYLEAANGPYASNPDPADGAEIYGELYPEDPPHTHIWTMLIFEPGPTAVKHTGYFSDKYEDVANRIEDANLGEPPFPYPEWDNIYFVGNPDVDPTAETLVRGKTYYWCVDETDGNNVVWQGPVWSFYVHYYYATKPNPPNEATNIDTDVLLCWQAGSDVDVHDVYIGTSWEDVNNADEFDITGIYQGWGADPNWQCSGLPADTKIYWRVDEVKQWILPPKQEIYKGDVWCFTTVSGEATVLDPADGEVIGGEFYPVEPPYTHIWTMLVFEPGPTAVKHTGYFSDKYEDVANRIEDANLGEPPYPYPGWDNIYFAGYPLVPPANDTLVRGTVYYWTVDATDAQGNTFAGDVWEFAICDFYAFEPNPPNEAVDVETTVLLSWYSGCYDNGHAVFLGTSWADVNDTVYSYTNPPPELLGGVWEPNILVTGLEFNTKYYWRVDVCTTRCFPFACCYSNKGDVWSFTTALHRIYVDVDAGGANNGASWENAYNYLQDALADANSAEKPVEIRVAGGIYTPDSNSAEPNGSGDRMATFKLIDGVTLKGGYAGYGEANTDARDIELYETILSGDLNDDDLPHSPYNTGENSFHVVTGSGTDANAVIDGFTVTSGRANIGSDRNGAGMYNKSASPTVVNCTFTRNVSNNPGGGMYNFGSSPNLSNCIFEFNSAYHGGGIYNQFSNPTIKNCKFIGNSASYGGAMDNYGSGTTVTNCKFIGNGASYGGGIYNGGSELTLANCVFSSNGASSGGSMRNWSSQLTLINCTFNENITYGYSGGQCPDGGSAGAIDNFGSNVTFISCAFIANRSGVYGALVCHESYLNLSNCTFAGNSGENGNSIVCISPSHYRKNELELSNCVFWDGGNEIWSNDGSVIIINYTNMNGGQAAVYDPCEGLVWGVGNMNIDPCFVKPGHWEDPCSTPTCYSDDIWIEGDYHLKSQAGRWDANSESWVQDNVTSPCIDAGNPGCPVGDEPSPNGNRRNMGAYGGTAEASKSPAYWRSIADITNDWIVDSNDLKIFAYYWLEAGQCIPSDLNRNQSADFADFALVALHWLEDNNPKRYCVVEDDVKYCIRMDKSVYHLGETVEILYRITNMGSVPVNLGWVPIPPFCYHFVIVDNNGEHVWQWSWEMPPMPPIEFILDAYESKEHEIGWDMINDNGTYETGDDFPIGPGTYKITGELLTGSEEDRVKVSVSVNVRE